MASGSIFKCFCDYCIELTFDELKHIYRLSARETLINRQAIQLFHAFLRKERLLGDKSEAEQYLDTYELCEKYLNEKRILDTNDVDKLFEAGLPYNYEKEIKNVIRTTTTTTTTGGDKFKIQMCLRRVQSYCRNEIEISGEYRNFKYTILDKLRNSIHF